MYNVHINQIRAHRHKPNPGAGIFWTVGAARVVLAAAAAAVPIWLIGADCCRQLRIRSQLDVFVRLGGNDDIGLYVQDRAVSLVDA